MDVFNEVMPLLIRVFVLGGIVFALAYQGKKTISSISPQKAISAARSVRDNDAPPQPDFDDTPPDFDDTPSDFAEPPHCLT
jgi:hypothetical protein